MFGYVTNLVSVPALALAVSWPVASALVVGIIFLTQVAALAVAVPVLSARAD